MKQGRVETGQGKVGKENDALPNGIRFFIIKINDAMFFYYLQVVLNFLWSILFFGLNLRFVAFIESILLGLVLIAMIYKFYKVDQRASLINIPYLLWIFFVIFLSYFIWILNK